VQCETFATPKESCSSWMKCRRVWEDRHPLRLRTVCRALICFVWPSLGRRHPDGRRAVLRGGECPVKSHTSTFGGNPIACAAALATLDVIQKQRLAEKAGTLGHLFYGEASNL